MHYIVPTRQTADMPFPTPQASSALKLQRHLWDAAGNRCQHSGHHPHPKKLLTPAHRLLSHSTSQLSQCSAQLLAVVPGDDQRPKKQKFNCPRGLWVQCIGRESNPGLADIRLLQRKHQMATANFTTKPPMLDESCSKMGSKKPSFFGSDR
jgi:hypothetical protein